MNTAPAIEAGAAFNALQSAGRRQELEQELAQLADLEQLRHAAPFAEAGTPAAGILWETIAGRISADVDAAGGLAEEELTELEELRQLAELATVPLYREEQRAARALERLEQKAGRTPAHLRQATADLLEKERAELAGIRHALELSRKHNPTRRAILAKVG